MLVCKFPKALKVRARIFRVLAPWGHGHESPKAEIGTSPDYLDQLGKILRCDAALGLFFGKLHFHEDVETSARFIQAPGQFGRIDSVYELEKSSSFLCLIRLQMANEVKSGARERCYLWRLPLEFLDIILPEVANAQRVSFVNHGRRKDFGYSNERDLFALASCPARRSQNSLFDLL